MALHDSNNIELEKQLCPKNVTRKRTQRFGLQVSVRCALSQIYPFMDKLLKNKQYQDSH